MTFRGYPGHNIFFIPSLCNSDRQVPDTLFNTSLFTRYIPRTKFTIKYQT